MNSKNLLLLQILSLILINVDQLWAACGSCSANTQMACTSETEYQFCVNNMPSGTSATCPTGYICSTATNVICIQNVAGNVPSCNDCNTCDSNLVYACTSTNTYALCLGGTTVSAENYTCPNGYVCNTQTAQICSTSTTTTPTCPIAGTTSPTVGTTPSFPPTVPPYAQYFCSVMRQNKRFQVPPEYDSSCKSYIYCFRTTEGNWSGQIYTCAGSLYFDPISLYCVANRPTNC